MANNCDHTPFDQASQAYSQKMSDRKNACDAVDAAQAEVDAAQAALDAANANLEEKQTSLTQAENAACTAETAMISERDKLFQCP